jgi:catalase
LTDKLVADIEDGNIPMRDAKLRTKVLTEKHEFDKNDTTKIWGFGPFGEGPNMLFDLTQGC